MLEQIIEKFEFMNSLIDILNPLELYEFLNHQKMLEVVDSDIRISENDLRSDPTLNISDEKLFVSVFHIFLCLHECYMMYFCLHIILSYILTCSAQPSRT